ncbi:MAG: hypothetical protein EWV92_05595 [Microcystis aeruginosa Ma_MB_S_20031200_S102]|uniref:Uncharacterized protein n=1 Tax=Microcystis aeruginosa Ma_MB_S_20031200_S102 TaxID=2486254 RepID=A0A552F054_MICAE|nr:MAG: hypothetical protein EWV79_06045 [Microcystis aeruginosa Ma_MB_S_20031200_S102D]TRU40103.1 MAG: hypothetical protein EWV92_05595 [Microcystis aeruginosa Ma_MB_S_20031200_S102]
MALFEEKKSKSFSQQGFYTKSVEYRLVMRRGKSQRGINNQFLITRFSIRFIQQTLLKNTGRQFSSMLN